MKQIILLFLLFGIVTQTAKSQTYKYHPFPDSNARWRVAYHENEGCATDISYDMEYDYTFGNDTIVNGHRYHNLYRKGISKCERDPHYDHFLEYAGAIRQDTLLKRVYWLYHGQDTLLYDFNLKAGDTVRGILVRNTIVVLYIDTVKVLDGSLRKKFNITLNGSASQFFIEGIGSYYGLLEPLFYFESGGDLICYKQNDKPVYDSSEGECDRDLYAGVEQFQRNSFSIFPNPLTSGDPLTIQFSGPQSLTSIRIYNALGVLVKEIPQQNSSDIFRISLNNFLSPGIYFLQCMASGSYYSGQRFIVQ